ncbi:hypothetical protein INT48_003609 [Thamnidium elegans]|uniref:Uncharacterized protein n=1 Tax=Thamnidium elegans TaxID=101142 RepID=A0A8H7VWV9_9FUNG|nr:hypothetical protein INT48_003609 [Thamnidium elegans]
MLYEIAARLLEMKQPMKKQDKMPLIQFVANQLHSSIEQCRFFWKTASSSPSVRTPANNDWQFMDDYKKEHGTKMNWTTCYEAGKNIGLFSKYTSLKSVQAAYYRAVNKNK